MYGYGQLDVRRFQPTKTPFAKQIRSLNRWSSECRAAGGGEIKVDEAGWAPGDDAKRSAEG